MSEQTGSEGNGTGTTDLLTGKQLVAALREHGVYTFRDDVLEHWLREEPPLPIAQAGQRGQAHRYRLADVLAWLDQRSKKERVKGYTPPGAEPNFTDPRNYKAYHEGRLAKLKADEAEGKLIPAEDFERVLKGEVAAWSAGLNSLVPQLDRDLDGITDRPDRLRILQAAVDGLRNRLARRGEQPLELQASS